MPRRAAATLALLLAASSLAAGCLDTGGPTAGLADCPAPPATLGVGGLYSQTAPDQAWQTLALAPGGMGDDARTVTTTLAWSASDGWEAHGAPVVPGVAPRLEIGTVSPGAGRGEATLGFAVRGPGDCSSTGTVTWDLSAPVAGEAALPGQGVHVMTAGFFENGTLFYTNIPEVDTDPRWPHVAWYAWEGDMPLPVYVYDADRSEQPAVWKGAYGNLPKPPAAGAPIVDDAVGSAMQEVVVPVADTLDVTLGLGYFTTIPGFNDGLKGLSTTTTRVVHLTPEQAYTRAGAEAHPLYGAPIVFYIKVLDVVDLPCPHVLVDPATCALPDLA